MLHIDKRVGSIKAGKDADIVVWSANPLSIYAVDEKTYIDGVPYWDIEKNAAILKSEKADEARIIQKMIAAKNRGAVTQRPTAQRRPREEDADEDDDAVLDKVIEVQPVQTQNHQ
jgi:hypothetical protein